MKHDIFSRGMTEPIATIVAFLIVLGAGGTTFAPELSAIVGTGGSGIVAFTLASKLFMGVPPPHDGVALTDEARKLYAYSAPISAHQLLTALLSKLDVIMLGSFVGRVPGVTLATVGIYSGVLDLAIGLRKVNQSFNPIFAPVVAGMVATGEKESAAATYTRLGQWMLWILLPFVAVMALAAPTILMIYPPSFQQGTMWLGLVAGACAINAFVSLGDTAIIVQRPHLNLLHSAIACAISIGANYLLISRLGATGAAFGSLVPFVILGILRSATLRLVFRWNYSWSNILAPAGAAIIALIPALVCRLRLDGIAGQVTSSAVFLAVFGIGWWYRLALEELMTSDSPRS